MQLTITTNFPQVQRQLDALQADVRNAALARTLNRTIEQSRTEMSKQIRSEFAVKAAYVRERLKIRRASFKSGKVILEAELSGRAPNDQRSANLIAFSARQTAKGVSVLIRRKGGRKELRGAFIANKGRTVFTRVRNTAMASRSAYRGTKHAEQIAPMQTIDIAQMFTTRRINSAVIKFINAKLPGIFEREVKFATQRFNR